MVGILVSANYGVDMYFHNDFIGTDQPILTVNIGLYNPLHAANIYQKVIKISHPMTGSQGRLPESLHQ